MAAKPKPDSIVLVGAGTGLLAGLALGLFTGRRSSGSVGLWTYLSTKLRQCLRLQPASAEAGKESGFTGGPPRPVHYALRPGSDPRLDQSMFVRYDPSPSTKTGALFIVIPGGNYDESDVYCGEGQPIAQWLSSHGITAVVLQYRCVSRGHYWPAQLEDWQACAREVQASARAWGCDPERVGVIGFSAGGHLASYVAARAEAEIKPKLQVLVYPAIDTLSPHDNGDIDPWDASLGYPPACTSTHLLVDESTPPTFLVGLTQDTYTPIEENADVYAKVLKEMRVPVEYHQGAEDGHGCGLKDWWTLPCEAWLRSHGWACDAEADATA